MKKIEKNSIYQVRKIVNDKNDIDIEVSFHFDESIIFTRYALMKIKIDFEEILKDDFYSGEQDKRLLKNIIDRERVSIYGEIKNNQI